MNILLNHISGARLQEEYYSDSDSDSVSDSVYDSDYGSDDDDDIEGKLFTCMVSSPMSIPIYFFILFLGGRLFMNIILELKAM